MSNFLSLDDIKARRLSSECVIRSDETVTLSDLSPENLAGCKFEEGSQVVFLPPQDVQGSADPAPALPQTAIEPKEPTTMSADASVPSPLSELPVPENTKAVVEQVSQLADIKSAIPQGQGGLVTVILAGLAVAGGGTAWKFWNNFSKQKHEEAMARIENEGKKQEDAHQKCAVDRIALERRVEEVDDKADANAYKLETLMKKVEVLEQAAQEAKSKPSVDLGDFDPEELEERLVKLEKSLKKSKKG